MQHKRALSLLLLALILILMRQGPSLDACDGVRAADDQDRPLLLRLHVTTREELDAVAGWLDIWEVHLDQGFVLASVTSAEAAWLENQGYQMEREPAVSYLAAVTPLEPRYYYYDDDYVNAQNRYVVDFLQGVEAAYPHLVELVDIGDAWQASHGGHARDLWVLRITNEDPVLGDPTAKPAFILIAAIHAREVVAPEVAIRYIQYLTGGYGGQGGYGLDPDATWLVDHHAAYVAVMLNPDGHRVNEADIGAFRRKNMDDDGCIYPNLWGVDLNRNHSFYWGQGGSSTDPCSEVYRGPVAASEPETQALQAYLAALLPDQNGENGDLELPLVAPDDATGILVSLHSYGDMVLWPWGFSTELAPNGLQLQAIGRKLAYLNGYRPFSASKLYATSGTTDDWVYGKLGAAAFTFEMGPGYYPSEATTCAGFFPAYDCIDGPGTDGAGDFWAENLPALIYAHKIARTPYQMAYGPDALDLNLLARVAAVAAPLRITARIDDTRYQSSHGLEPSQNIAAAELYLDLPPWSAGSMGQAMTPVDGAFDGDVEEVEILLDPSGLAPGRHILWIRGQDADGQWGAASAAFLDISSDARYRQYLPLIIRAGE